MIASGCGRTDIGFFSKGPLEFREGGLQGDMRGVESRHTEWLQLREDPNIVLHTSFCWVSKGCGLSDCFFDRSCNTFMLRTSDIGRAERDF